MLLLIDAEGDREELTEGEIDGLSLSEIDRDIDELIDALRLALGD